MELIGTKVVQMPKTEKCSTYICFGVKSTTGLIPANMFAASDPVA